MHGLTRWCMTHRRWVVITWVAIAIIANVAVSVVGRQYASNFSLPGTESQHVVDLLTSQFKAQSGDVDTIVFHYANGRYDATRAKAAIEPLLKKVAADPHVVSVLSPYGPQGALQVSKDGHTAFATVNYSKRAYLLADNTGKPVLRQIDAVHVPGLQIAAGGPVIENAEGFNIGPATYVGVLAAMVILLLTFGSFVAAGLPLITAGLGLITGIALVGLATRITSMSNVAPELALMIGLGVGVDYSLFIVTRFREAYARLGDVEASVIEAMDTSGRAILLAGATVVIALLGMFATGVAFMYGLSIASVLAVLLVLTASLTVVPALLSRFGHRIVRPSRSARRREASGLGPRESAWRRWSLTVQGRPKSLAVVSLAVMVICLIPFFSLRLDSSDAGNDPTNTSTYRAFNMLSHGFGPGFNGPLLVAVEMPNAGKQSVVPRIRAALTKTSDVVAVTAARTSPSGKVAVMEAYPRFGAAGGGHDQPRQHAEAAGVSTAQASARGGDIGRWLHGRIDRLLARSVGEAPAVHRNRRGAVGAVAACDLPVGRDPDPGRPDEPAHHRRRARRDGRRVPVGLGLQHSRDLQGPDRALDTRADVRGRVRPVDGLRGVPDLACA